VKPEDLAIVRIGAEMQNYAPYIQYDIDKMKRAVVNEVMALMSTHDFTAEVALAKWYEYVSFERLMQKVNKKITAGQEMGKMMPAKLGE
jgi:hypothetical protein